MSNNCNSYEALRRPSYETCDFCDMVFNNRYESIIHNASHIIIPLLRESLFHCKQCWAISTSLEDVQKHVVTKHPVTVVLKKHPITVNIKKEIKDEIQITDWIKTEDNKNEILNDDIKSEEQLLTSPIQPIKNRLKFEEEVSISNGLIKDLVTECKVSVQLFDPPWLFTSNRSVKSLKKNGINGNGNESVTQICNEPVHESISYSSLMKPGIFNCRYCAKSYPNRFSLIKHEKFHMKLSKGRRPILCTHCDRFIAGNYLNLQRHIELHHPGTHKKKFETYICKRCGLRFKKYKRHVKNYHLYDCSICGKELNSPEELANHITSCNLLADTAHEYTRLIKLCNLCYSFYKNRVNLNYCSMGVTDNQMGVRYACEDCGKKFFQLNVVKRTHNQRKNLSYNKNKRVTNEDRLKNIQQRLKKLNLLNKCYFVVSFHPLGCFIVFGDFVYICKSIEIQVPIYLIFNHVFVQSFSVLLFYFPQHGVLPSFHSVIPCTFQYTVKTNGANSSNVS